jgi:hypothetical protein
MSAKLPSVYTPNEYRERMNREVREKFGDKTHHAFDPIHSIKDINKNPHVRHYEDKYHAMSPYLKDRFDNARGIRGVDVAARPFKPMGGKKKRKMTHKRKKSRKGRKTSKRRGRKTKSRRR